MDKVSTDWATAAKFRPVSPLLCELKVALKTARPDSRAISNERSCQQITYKLFEADPTIDIYTYS